MAYFVEENTPVTSHLEVADRLKIFLTQVVGWNIITDKDVGGVHRWVYHSYGESGQESIYIQIEHDPATPDRLVSSGWAFYDPVTDTGVFQLKNTNPITNAQTVIANGFVPTEVNFYGDRDMFIIAVKESAMGGLVSGSYLGLIDTLTRRQAVATLTQEALVPPGLLGSTVELFVDYTDPFVLGNLYQLRADQGILTFTASAIDPGVSVSGVISRTPLNHAAWPVGTRISAEALPLYIDTDLFGLGNGFMFNFQPSKNPYQSSNQTKSFLYATYPGTLALNGTPYIAPIYKRLIVGGGAPVENRGVLRHLWFANPSPGFSHAYGDTFEAEDGKTYRLYCVWGALDGYEVGGVAVEL